MYNILDLVYSEKENILSEDYVFFNNAKPNDKEYIQIEDHYFWTK